MIEKLRTAFWFLRRPSHWLHAVALVERRLSGYRHEAARGDATQWAAARAISTDEVLQRLRLIEGAGYPTYSEEQRAEAERRAASSQVQMGGPGDLALLYAATVLSGPQRVVETGVAYGWSSWAILSALEVVGRDGRLVSVDMPYPKQNNEAYVGVAVAPELRRRWTLIRKPDRNGLVEAIATLGGEIDLCHYDSDKSYEGRMFAYPRLWAALRPGGIFISDDIQDNFGFRDFFADKAVDVLVTAADGKYVGAVRKP